MQVNFAKINVNKDKRERDERKERRKMETKKRS
jgi:hypothetical protein